MSEEQVAVPKEIRNATYVIYLEAAGLLAAAAVVLDKAITGHPAKWWSPYALILTILLGVAILVLCARGIRRLSPAARTPIVLIQLLALPVAYSLGIQAGLYAYGIPILVLALTVLYLLFRPASNEALERSTG